MVPFDWGTFAVAVLGFLGGGGGVFSWVKLHGDHKISRVEQTINAFEVLLEEERTARIELKKEVSELRKQQKIYHIEMENVLSCKTKLERDLAIMSSKFVVVLTHVNLLREGAQRLFARLDEQGVVHPKLPPIPPVIAGDYSEIEGLAVSTIGDS